MRVLVCGGRDFSDAERLYKVLDGIHRTRGIDAIIEGNAPGADRLAGYWARRNKIDNLKFPAEWSRDGKAAGPLRNRRMIEQGRPDLIVAFPGGKGTADMVRQGRAAGITIQHEIKVPS